MINLKYYRNLTSIIKPNKLTNHRRRLIRGRNDVKVNKFLMGIRIATCIILIIRECDHNINPQTIATNSNHNNLWTPTYKVTDSIRGKCNNQAAIILDYTQIQISITIIQISICIHNRYNQISCSTYVINNSLKLITV